MATGNLTVEALKGLVASKEIDTVIIAFTDMQGRLVGKRASARLFLEELAEHGAECCNYLLAVDVENNTVDGYSISSWERGYGDMAMMPDLDTLRLTPWMPGTVMVQADLTWLDGTPVNPDPRQVLKRQLARLAERDLVAAAGMSDGRRVSTEAVDIALLESHANGITLNAGQATLVREMATSGARLQLG